MVAEDLRGRLTTNYFPGLEYYDGCDVVIRKELSTAGITVTPYEARRNVEIPTCLMGTLTQGGKPTVNFHRVEDYWLAFGLVPSQVVDAIDADPVGKKDVRADNDYMNQPNKQMKTARLREVTGLRRDEHEELGRMWEREVERVAKERDNQKPEDRKGCVGIYRIHSKEGLKLFAQTLRAHGLADPLPDTEAAKG